MALPAVSHTSSSSSSSATLPPMMQRYLEYKERYPDALLFIQVGDFYELFFDDAVTVAKALNLTLTSRDKNAANPIPMCGVPLAVLDGYIDRLLPLGHSVAVVSQSGSGQGVERALERFVTPGMRLFTSVSSDSSESLIAAVGIDPNGTTGAVACTDPQTGVLFIKEELELTAIGKELESLMVREAILPRMAFGEKLDRRARWVRNVEGIVHGGAVKFRGEPSATAVDGLTMAEEARAEFHLLGGAAKRAARLLLSYVDEVSLGSPLPISKVSLLKGDGRVYIDASTRRNLELVSNSKDGSSEGTLFGFINRCATAGGSRLLKSWVVQPLTDRDAINDRRAAVRDLLAQYGSICRTLAGLSDLERLAARIQVGVASPKDLGAVRDVLLQLPAIRATVTGCSSTLLAELAEGLSIPEELPALLERALVDSPPHTTNDGGIIRDGFDAELDDVKNLRQHADAWRAQFEARERQATGITSLKVKSNNVIGFFIELPTSQGAKVPAHYQRRQSTANAERFVTPELKQHEEGVVTAVDRQIRREALLFAELKRTLQGHVEGLRLIAGVIAHLDALAALAHVAAVYEWCEPVIEDGSSTLEISKGRHPIIAERLEGAFIPNSVAFGRDGCHCFIVTGPNMGGKSTYLRQTALITILAQIGSYVPAASARVGIVDRVFARLGASDDLHEGESTFMVEMREAAYIIANASRSSLVLIDELGRGTATSDGLSLAQAILERLAFTIQCRTLFATHYHELTALADETPKISNLSVGSIEEEDRVIFTHQIQHGPAPRSYGLEVAKLSGLPPEVLERAYALLAIGDQEVKAERAAKPPSRGQQLSLFSVEEVRPRMVKDPIADTLKTRVSELDLDGLSPRDALAELYRLRDMVREGGGSGSNLRRGGKTPTP